MTLDADASAKGATFLERYEADDDGLRFSDLTWAGNRPGLDPVVDGISGEKVMRSRARSGVLEKLSHEDVLRDEFTLDEMNDLNDYVAWNTFDMLALRATEGASGMIPRQEYELLSYMQMFYRYPEFFTLITDKIGAQGVIDIGATARTEIGTKINCVHNWAIANCCLLGRTGLLALEHIKADDYLDELSTSLKFGQRIVWGMRQDGWIYNSQDRYRCAIKEPALVERLAASVEEFADDEKLGQQFKTFNASAELLAFFDHYDSRLGVGDTGPYIRPDGRVMIVRDLFVNEDIHHWSDVCGDLPYSFTLVLMIDAEKLGLQEIRVNDISTTFTRPENYIPAITAGSVFVRQQWDTPMSDVYQQPIEDLGGYLESIREATLKMYDKTLRMPRRELIQNGIFNYYCGKLMPYLRRAGVYEEVCEQYEYWELDRRISDLYYEVPKRNFVQAVIPQKVFTGVGAVPFPGDKRPSRRSKYAYL